MSGVPQKKSPVTTPGIDHGTSRLVAQCLNHYANPGPHNNNNNNNNNNHFFIVNVLTQSQKENYGASMEHKANKRTENNKECIKTQKNILCSFCTVHFNIIIQYKPRKCTFRKLIF